MSGQELIQQSPLNSFIYPNSVEVSKTNPNKRYFKIFLMNNTVTKPTPQEWMAENVDVIERDIDTFIGRSVIPYDNKKRGKHVSPFDANIFPHRYPSKLDFVKDANAYYDKFGKAKIIAIYKPDQNVLNAAKQNPNIVANYEALGETEDPEFIKMLDEHEKNNQKIFVSPGIYSLDSYHNDKGVKVVKSFVGTHAHIVDDPAFTEPIAYIHKRVCNIDGKTCYYDLLTAAQDKDFNTNLQEQNNMSLQTEANPTNEVSLGKVVDDINKAGQVSDQELNNITIETESKDSQGKTIEKIKTDTSVEKGNGEKKQEAKKKEQKEKVNENKQGAEGNGSPEVKTEVNDTVQFTKAEFQNMLSQFKDEILNTVEAKQNEKIESATKIQMISNYIPNNNEELKADYDFYNSLPVSSQQLKKILEDSRFNPSNSKRRVNNNDLAVGSTSRNVNVTSYNDKVSRNRGSSEIHFLPGGKYIPKRYA